MLIVIGSAIGIGTAMEKSQAAAAIAGGLLNLAGGNRLLTLAAVYLATMLCTELITNNAAAVLMFSIALQGGSESLGMQSNTVCDRGDDRRLRQFRDAVWLPNQYDGLRRRWLSRDRLSEDSDCRSA